MHNILLLFISIPISNHNISVSVHKYLYSAVHNISSSIHSIPSSVYSICLIFHFDMLSILAHFRLRSQFSSLYSQSFFSVYSISPYVNIIIPLLVVFPSLFPLFPPPAEYMFLQYTSSLRLFFSQSILFLTALIMESRFATNVLPYPKLIMLSILTTDTPTTFNLFLVSSIAIGSPAHSYSIISIPYKVFSSIFPA